MQQSHGECTMIQRKIFYGRWFSLVNAMAVVVALRDLVLCAQFKKREKHPWRSVTFSKVAG